MSQIVRISALLFSSALLMFAGGMHGLILPVRGAEEGFSLLALGLIGTGWSIGFISGSITVPVLVRRVGHIRSYAVMAAIASMTILLNLLFIQDEAWIALRVFSGFCFAGAAMVVESWLNEVSDNESRGTTFSVYVSITLFASTAGQMAISVTGVAGYLPFVLAALAYSCAVLPTALTRSPPPTPLPATRLDIGLLFRTSPIAVIAAFSVGMANGAFGTLAPVYGIQRGFDTTTIAYVMSLAIVAGAIAQIPLGRLSDRIDRRKVLAGVALFGAVAGLLIVLFNPGENALLYILFGAYGLAAYSLYAIGVAHANDFASDGEFAKIAAGMLLVLGAGMMLGPIAASLIMQALGPAAIFVVTALFHALLAASAVIRMRMRNAPPAETRAPFQPLPSDPALTVETPSTRAWSPKKPTSPTRRRPPPLPPHLEESPMFPEKIDEQRPFVPVTFAILAVSDTRTLETDTSGALLEELIEDSGHRCADRAIVPDDIEAIREKVRAWLDEPTIDVVLTTGGTGFSGRDVTPEAVEPLFDKRMEGFSVLFHHYSATTIGTSTVQSRATAGLAGSTFVFCLPGSRGACRDAWEGILKHQFDSRHLPCNFIEVMPRLHE